MKIAVVTGASSGMGREFAEELDSRFRFDEIWLIARRKEKLIETAGMLRNKTRILPFDLLREDSVREYQKLLEETTADVLFLVNAAGFGKFGDYREVDSETSARMIDLNCKALVLMTMSTLPFMTEGAKIINLGSSSSFFPLINFNVYASTKAFVVHYSGALHDELKERKITVTAVSPGWVDTDFFRVAANTENVHGPKKYKPLLDPRKVARKGVEGALKGKKEVVYNLFSRLHRFGARFLPRRFMLRQWRKMQKK